LEPKDAALGSTGGLQTTALAIWAGGFLLHPPILSQLPVLCAWRANLMRMMVLKHSRKNKTTHTQPHAPGADLPEQSHADIRWQLCLSTHLTLQKVQSNNDSIKHFHRPLGSKGLHCSLQAQRKARVIMDLLLLGIKQDLERSGCH
jgi:hypothetical protein